MGINTYYFIEIVITDKGMYLFNVVYPDFKLFEWIDYYELYKLLK